MHATPHTNLFGITTHYGTHPKPPRRRHLAKEALTWTVAAVLILRRRAQT